MPPPDDLVYHEFRREFEAVDRSYARNESLITFYIAWFAYNPYEYLRQEVCESLKEDVLDFANFLAAWESGQLTEEQTDEFAPQLCARMREFRSLKRQFVEHHIKFMGWYELFHGRGDVSEELDMDITRLARHLSTHRMLVNKVVDALGDA